MNSDQYISSGVLELYVAGVLPPEEMRELHARIKADPKLQAEVEEIEATIQSYALVQSPPLEKELLPGTMEKLQHTPPATAEPQTIPLPQPKKKKEKPVKEAAPAELTKVVPLKEERTNGNGYFMWVAILAIFLLLSLGGNIYLYRQSQSLNKEVAAASQEKQRMTAALKDARGEYDALAAKMHIYQNPDYKPVMLKPMPKMPESSVMVFWNQGNKDVYLKVMELPKAPADKQYQLWAMDKDNNPVNAGMIPKNMSPGELIRMKSVDDAGAFAITLEPMGGSTEPTVKEMYVQGSI